METMPAPARNRSKRLMTRSAGWAAEGAGEPAAQQPGAGLVAGKGKHDRPSSRSSRTWPGGSDGNRDLVDLRVLAGQAEAQVLAVVDGLVEEPGDVVVVEGVDGGPAVPGARNEAEVAEHPELVGHRGLLHADVGGEPGDRAGLAAQPGQDQQ